MRRHQLTLLAFLLTLVSACNSPAAQQQPSSAAQPAQSVLTPAQPPAELTPSPDASAHLPTTTPPMPATDLPKFDPQTTELVLTPYVTGLDLPVYLTHAGDGTGRTFIVEKNGRIRIVQDNTLLQTPFLDITDRVGSWANEQGLLGLAFAPDYATSGALFVNYTDKSGDTVIARFAVSEDPNLADPSSESRILQIDQPAPNHNGGMLAFGPDGMLYIGTGDGGGSNDTFGNGQNPYSLLGKMLRINVSDPSVPYTIPADNPWVTTDWNGEDVRDEIWAIGLRNPWRFSHDRATGDLWIADVGQNKYEEVNMTQAGDRGGLNYGWPMMEGQHCFSTEECSANGLVMPIAEYDHSGHCSITGGYAYRGSANPKLRGVYLYGDYCSGTIWAAVPNEDGTWNAIEVLRSGATISSFGEDEEGELYLLDYEGTAYLISAQ